MCVFNCRLLRTEIHKRRYSVQPTFLKYQRPSTVLSITYTDSSRTKSVVVYFVTYLRRIICSPCSHPPPSVPTTTLQQEMKKIDKSSIIESRRALCAINCTPTLTQHRATAGGIQIETNCKNWIWNNENMDIHTQWRVTQLHDIREYVGYVNTDQNCIRFLYGIYFHIFSMSLSGNIQDYDFVDLYLWIGL